MKTTRHKAVKLSISLPSDLVEDLRTCAMKTGDTLSRVIRDQLRKAGRYARL
jgi:hypothetical protein